ncbi:hypothetical protein GGR56DRAFT_335913 [Xylariaceae sp. FL0804]|nr:hypothetical protein GGR56DRAFT_335913 [Xylariaceae sp. FL0804]
MSRDPFLCQPQVALSPFPRLATSFPTRHDKSISVYNRLELAVVMKPFIVAVAFISSVVAQDLGGLPSCARSCLSEFTSGNTIGTCPRLDVACICGSSSFISGIACCLSSVCSAADQESSVQYAAKLCDTVGVQVPSSVSCTSGSMTSRTTAATDTTSTSPVVTSTAAVATSVAASSTSSSPTSTPNAAPRRQGSDASLLGGLLAALALL